GDQIKWLNSLQAGAGVPIPMAHNSFHEKVYGRFNTMGRVYVPVHRDSPKLCCLSWHMRHHDLLDSTVTWIGPTGILHNGRHNNITHDKGIVLKNAQVWMSGEYSCMITYSTVLGKEVHHLHFRFLVF
uniref:zona pellucida-binding protein 1-like n=1 Tax=Myxine glutinosa TaxID=7769 RepID=UPI00358E5AFB